MKQKIGISVLILILLICVCGSAFATTKTNLNVIKQASETKQLENDQGRFSKTIVDSKPESGEVTIEVKLVNTKKETETDAETEIYLVVDNSPSMGFVTASGETRKKIILESANKLVKGIFNTSSKVKVGLIDFHGGGGFNSAGSHNATIRQKLTDDKSAMLTAIEKQMQRSTSSGTNIDAGLQKAQKNFSEGCKNRVIILLTDGVPNALSDGTYEGNDVTTEKAIQIQNGTKKTIQNIKASGTYVISMLTGLNASDGNKDESGTEYESENTVEEELAAAERVFGTTANPVANKYYLVKSADVNTIVTKDILRDVTEKIQNPINKVKIVDYFPADITENFDFTYNGKPTQGTISEKIDTTNKTITWDVGTVKGDGTVTVRYTLKIKDMNNPNLLGKTIATNEKLVLTYQDTAGKDYTVTLDSSPTIQLAEVKEEVVEPAPESPKSDDTKKPTSGDKKVTTTADTTKASGSIPQTGATATFGIILLAVLGIAGIAYHKNKNYKDIQ